ncbi:MAG: hypothetical protein ACQGVC_01700 [Myxococcota bacterium]
MPSVIVVPEIEGFHEDVSHRGVVWVNKNLGVPKLEDRDVSYLAPYWIGDAEGVNRVFHILEVRDTEPATEIQLGNSFVVAPVWTNMGQHRRFEYHSLWSFGFVEVAPGLLLAVPGEHAS